MIDQSEINDPATPFADRKNPGKIIMNRHSLKALATLLALTALMARLGAAQPSQSTVDFGTLSGESAGIQKGAGDASPDAASSHINDYTHQDEQMNLDANAGNVRVLRTDQKALLNDFVTKTYELTDADPREIRNVFRTILGLEGGRAEVIKQEQKKGGMLQVICPKFMIPYLDRAIPALDKWWLSEKKNGSVRKGVKKTVPTLADGAADAVSASDSVDEVAYRTQYRDAAEVNRVASEFGSDEGISVVDTASNTIHRLNEVPDSPGQAAADNAAADGNTRSPREQEILDYFKIYQPEMLASHGAADAAGANDVMTCPDEIATGGTLRDNFVFAASEADLPANQVLLEVKIVEIASNNDHKLGLDFVNWKNGPGADLAQFLFTGIDADATNEVFSSVFDPFLNPEASRIHPQGNTVNYDTNYDASYRAANYLLTSNFIDFLENKGTARVLHNEKLLARTAKTATLSANDEVVAMVSTHGDPLSAAATDEGNPGIGDIVTLRTSGHHNGQTGTLALEDEDGDATTISTHALPVRHGERKLSYTKAGATGIFLSFTPFVGFDTMELVADIQIGDANGLAPNGTPIIDTRTVTTTVRLADGELGIIAGLKRTHDVRESNKVPFLGNIPVLGYLFGQEQDVQRTNDVVILVKPSFIVYSVRDKKRMARTRPNITSAKEYVVDLQKKVLDPKKNPIPLPDTEKSLGFDQWLLGK